MKTKLTKIEIKVLDGLYQKWAKHVTKNNERFFEKFYSFFKLTAPRLENYDALPFEILKRAFIGENKPFKGIWELFQKICEYSRMVDFRTAPIRIKLAQGTIVIIHNRGEIKAMVLSIFQNGANWTYKQYLIHSDFKQELEERERGSKWIPFTKLFFSRPHGTRTLPITKEEYGGADLDSLSYVADRTEYEILLRAAQRYNLPAKPSNSTYNPKTKRFYVIDSG
ncbi:TPA: hypothetical protein H1012_02960 [archaeon]|nr:hypothetical protein [Candidatus Naiadarchaeales archaeon SRR2090153.bin461]HIK02778.1 hypothetical protein [Candidatus Naiadarchaeales archaeon SRR2090159.bin1288]